MIADLTFYQAGVGDLWELDLLLNAVPEYWTARSPR
jgi:hypothetical protein